VEYGKQYHLVTEVFDDENDNSLKDLIYNMHYKLNIQDKIQIALSIAKGLLFLHEKGYIYSILKTSVISIVSFAKLDLRLTSLIFAVPVATITSKTFLLEKHAKAPELISGTDITNNPFAIEVYSFSIVMYEILFRRDAFGDLDIREQDIITNQIRPEIPNSSSRSSLELQYIELMKQCWQSEPDLRPTMRTIVFTLAQLIE
jgi:serine/threonine protein kinase